MLDKDPRLVIAELAERIEKLEAEIKRLEKLYDDVYVENERLRAALEGVLAEADRKTDAFDKAHAALAHAAS